MPTRKTSDDSIRASKLNNWHKSRCYAPNTSRPRSKSAKPTHVRNKRKIHSQMNVDQWASEDRRAEESNIPDHELAPTPSEERKDGPTPREWHEYNSYWDNLHYQPWSGLK